MARTKQTARKAYIGKGKAAIPRKTLISRKGINDRIDQSQSQSLQEIVNNQQFSLRFDDQEKCQKDCVSSQIVKCKQCEAVLTSQSKIFDQKQYNLLKKNPSLSDQKKQKFLSDYEKVWICQFCMVHNSIPKSYNPPVSENPCFLIEKIKKKISSEQNVNDANKVLIFCIDISGSMDFKQNNKSRLQSLKEAISNEIKRMKSEKEQTKVGLITFGSYVDLIGDGKSFMEKRLEIQSYKDFDEVVKITSKIDDFCQPISKSYKSLIQKVQDLVTFGSTALGPGLLAAVELASKGSVGSKVIICTDGQANVGMGGSFNADRFTFYNQLAQYSKKKRVMVNILSLKGDRCNLKQLGKLSLATGGCLLKIDPATLGTQFSKITKDQVLGSSSQLVIKLNKIFQICNAVQTEVSKDLTTLTQDFGNFTAETELTFEFAILDKEEAMKNPSIDLDIYNQEKIPMQIQLSYVGRDGSKYLQIVTDWRQLTNDQKAIYDGANFGLFAASVLQRASKKIKNQQFKDATAIINGYWSLVNEKFSKTETKDQLTKFEERVKKVQKVLHSKMKKAGQAVKKSDKKQKKQEFKVVRGRERRRVETKSKKKRGQSRSRSRDRLSQLLESDDQNQCLIKQMRARSRSISPPKGKKK